MTAPRLGFLLLFFGLILSRGFGGDSSAAAGINAESGEAKSRARIRRVLLDCFPYDASARAKNPEQASPVLMHPVTAEPDVVVLPPLEVRSRRLDPGLHDAIANWKDPGPQNHSRFGTGVHEKDFGKVRAGVTTILYIPIAVGISW